MTQHVCIVCGYVYDSEIGDESNGIKEGTDFEDIPYEWVCPVCSSHKEAFEEID